MNPGVIIHVFKCWEEGVTEKPTVPVCPGSRGFSDMAPPVPKLGKALGKMVQVDKPKKLLGIHFGWYKGHREKKLENIITV